jgi:hypothetical protein
MFDFLRRLFASSPPPIQPRINKAPLLGDDNIDLMNEGDYHSGPYGYSPNTAYPETQYGSGFDEDADWNEEHR